MKTELVNLSQIELNAANPRIIKNDKFEKLINSLLALPKMLDLRPIVVDNTMVALGGNMRYRALSAIADMSEDELKDRLSGIRDFQKKTQAEQDNLVEYWLRWKDKPTAPVIKASELTDAEQREFIIKDNVGFGEWDMDALANEWDNDDLVDWGVDVWQENGAGESSGGGEMQGGSEPKTTLNDRFVVPPFSILDTRKGYWQARKKMWRELIGDMGESRSDTLIQSPEIKYKDLYQKTRQHREELGLSFKEYLDKYVPDEVKEREAKKVLSQGVSLFDPVLSEICCKWFTPSDGSTIFDCFAGDTQKGLVFGMCGHNFTGIELRQEQVDINNRVIEGRDLPIRYICDDGQNVAAHFSPDSQDMLFSCPPYYDLEVYSDKENDASNQDTYEGFIGILRNAFSRAITCLKENRFAVIVVGDVRNKKTGGYYNFVDDVKRIFCDNGMLLYNELILIETGASTALRASRYMDSRKVAKMHQNILVFYKGRTKDIPKHFKKIEFTEDELSRFEQDCEGETTSEGCPQDPSAVQSDETPVKDGMIKVKISGKWIKHKFRCSEDYIRNVCHGSCCTGSDKVLISLLPDEAERQKQLGYAVKDGKLCASPTTHKCPHISPDGLCRIHFTPDKPFGCIASPFTLNKANTLIIRNRYSMMKCHGDGDYAYRVFRASLDLIFGKEEAQRICDYYDHNDGDLTAYMTKENYDKIIYLDSLKH